MVSWAPGSAIAGFDLAEPGRKVKNFEHLAENSLDTFLNGLSEITAAETPDTPIPRGFDRRVLETCAKLDGLLKHGVAAITFAAPSSQNMSTVKYDAWVGERIRVLAIRARSHVRADELEFFKDEAQLMRSVPSVKHTVKHTVVTALPEIKSSFWKSTPLEQLVADQGIPPITDIRELDAIWSEGDAFDDALSELLEERAKRRREVPTP
jgi:hypothetical protein